jgi:hypothetical protein
MRRVWEWQVAPEIDPELKFPDIDRSNNVWPTP